MSTVLIWLFVLLGLYWGYCVFWGLKGFYRARTASDYFLAGRQIPMWVFVLAATATSFSGWTFIGHPYLISVDGLPYAFASFYVITIPLTGTLFLKRQWMLGKRFGYVTPGEMYSDYYGSEAMRWLTVLVALTYSIPYLALQFRASGVLFSILTDGAVGVNFGMWALSLIVLVYVALGGLRSVAYVDTAQCLMLTAGIVILGVITMVKVGGWSEFVSAFGETIAREMAADADLLGRPVLTPEGYHRMVGMPGAIQVVPAASQAEGGIWTGTMILTYLFALVGIQASPAFSMWAFANTNPRPFAPQQVWASALGVGLCLFVFSTLQGLGGRILIGKGLLPLSLLEPGGQDQLVPALVEPRGGAGADPGGAPRRVRPGGHAVHGVGVHVDHRRDDHARHVRALRQPPGLGRPAEGVGAPLGLRHHPGRAGRRHLHRAGPGHARAGWPWPSAPRCGCPWPRPCTSPG